MTWCASAACRDVHTDLFFAGTAAAERMARSICRRCPVTEACLMTAMMEESTDERRFGIFGGLDPGERHRLARSGVASTVAAARLADALRVFEGAA